MRVKCISDKELAELLRVCDVKGTRQLFTSYDRFEPIANMKISECLQDLSHIHDLMRAVSQVCEH